MKYVLEAVFKHTMLYWYKNAIKTLKVLTLKKQIANCSVGWQCILFHHPGRAELLKI